MPYFLECIIGTLAAVGFICILKGVYDIIMTSYARTGQPATLFLSGDGTSPDSEHLLLAAEQARRLYTYFVPLYRLSRLLRVSLAYPVPCCC